MNDWKKVGLADLHRQGFMKGSKAGRKAREKKPIVACELCQDWHEEGRHVKKCPHCKLRHHHHDQCGHRVDKEPKP